MKQDFTKLDRLLQEFAGRTVPGCACAVMQDGELVYEGCYGRADLAAQTPVTSRSMFRQENLSHLFTYTVLAMLYEQGRFLYSDPIGEYLPEWKDIQKYVVRDNGTVDAVPLSRPLTIRTAASSMCGLPNVLTPAEEARTPTRAAMDRRMEALYAKGGTPTLREEVRAMAGVPVMFEPYSHWHYGFGIQVAGAVVEEITGKPLRQVYREMIIDPLGLKDTDTYITDGNRDRVVTAYRKQADGSFAADAGADRWYDPSQTPVGARPLVLASAADLAAFMQMLASGGTYRGQKYLGSGTVAMMMSNQLENPHYPDFLDRYKEGYAYGMGFYTVVRMKYGHNGHYDNFGSSGEMGTWAEADPTARLAIVYGHNMTPSEDVYHHHRVRAAAYGCAL